MTTEIVCLASFAIKSVFSIKNNNAKKKKKEQKKIKPFFSPFKQTTDTQKCYVSDTYFQFQLYTYKNVNFNAVTFLTFAPNVKKSYKSES